MDTVTTPAKKTAPAEYPTIYDTWDEFHSAFAGRMLPLGPIKSDVLGSFASCGISVLSGLSGTAPARIVDKILKERASTDRKNTREAFVVFSDIDRHPDSTHGGGALCRYIKENNLGDIIEAGPRMNPNTGNRIKMWIWSPPHESLNPNDKYLPVHGKRLIRMPSGMQAYVEPGDSRFAENLNPAREA